MENDSIGLLSQLLKLRSLASGLAQKSGQFNSLKKRFNSLFLEAEDLLDECKLKFENLETNPDDLETVESRLDQLNSLLQKHKVNSDTELIKIEKHLEERLTKTSDIDSELKLLQDEEQKLEKSLVTLSSLLTKSRKSAIKILENKLENLVIKMGMTKIQ